MQQRPRILFAHGQRTVALPKSGKHAITHSRRQKGRFLRCHICPNCAFPEDIKPRSKFDGSPKCKDTSSPLLNLRYGVLSLLRNACFGRYTGFCARLAGNGIRRITKRQRMPSFFLFSWPLFSHLRFLGRSVRIKASASNTL